MPLLAQVVTSFRLVIIVASASLSIFGTFYCENLSVDPAGPEHAANKKPIWQQHQSAGGNLWPK